MKKILIVFGLIISAGIFAQPFLINVGTSPNSGDGDNLRDAFIKVNANFIEAFELFDLNFDDSLYINFFVDELGGQGTIVDNETYFQINYPTGDVIDVGKDQVVHLIASDDYVFIMSSAKWGSVSVAKIIAINAIDFGFLTSSALQNYLSRICFNSYRIAYTYDGSGNLNTVRNYIGDSLMFTITYTYDGSTITGKSAPTH
jgi:hypothetical protein